MRLFAVLLLLAVLIAPALAYECYGDVLAGTGAIIWWTFDDADIGGGATDVCGGQTNGSNSAGVNTGAAGKFGEAYDYTGTGAVNPGQHATYNAASTEPDFHSDQNFSWSFWVNPDGDPNTNYFPGAVAYDGTTTYSLSYDTAVKNRFSCQINQAGNVATAAGAATAGAGKWTHIACVWHENNKTVSLFTNGPWTSSGQNNAINGNLYTANTRFSAGAGWQHSVTDWRYGLNGKMDEFAVFNHTLTASQVSRLYTDNEVNAAACAAPTLTLTAPADGSYVNTNQTYNATLTYYTCNGAAHNVTLYVNGTYKAMNTTALVNGTISIPWTFDAGDGAYVWGMYVSNSTTRWAAGNNNFTVYYDTTDPVANWTISSTAPYMVYDTLQFNDTSTDALGSVVDWNWTFGDGNSSVAQNATNTFVYPGQYEVCLTVEDDAGNSDQHCVNVTVNGFAIDVWNEKTLAAIPNWSATISNSTVSYTYGPENNTWVWDNFTGIPTGSVTIVVSATGYVLRTYYAVYNVGSYIYLDAYLLDSASGVYPVFIVREAAEYTPIEGAILTFSKSISGAWETVGQATADATGTAQVYLNPDTTYRLVITFTGCTTYTTTAFTPISTTYVITLDCGSTASYISVDDILYMEIYPTTTNAIPWDGTITFVCNDPWSNVDWYNMTIVHTNGTLLFTQNGTSAACGIIEEDVDNLGTTNHTEFIVYGYVYRNGQLYQTHRIYGITASLVGGFGGAMYDMRPDLDANVPGFGSDWTYLLALFLVGGVTIGASMYVGWGAGLLGAVALALMVAIEWVHPYIAILAVVAMFGVYATRRWDR